MEQKIDLDALEAALAKEYDMTGLSCDIHYAREARAVIPALIAELRELRAYRAQTEAIFAPEAQ